MTRKFLRSKIAIDTHETGRRLKHFRTSQNITIAELSQKTGLSKGMISETETGKNKPSPNLLLALLNIYALNLNWLLTGRGEMFIADELQGAPDEKDYGYLNEEIHDLLWHLENTMVVKLAVVGFFLEYMYQNEDLIKNELDRKNKNNDKEKDGPRKQKVG